MAVAVKRWAVSTVVVAVAAGVVGIGVAAGRGATSRDAVHPRVLGRQETAPPAEPNGIPPGFVEYRDERAGFAVSYPSNWTRLESTDPQVGLVVTLGERGSFLARVVHLPKAVAPSDLPGLRALTDRAMSSGGDLEVLSGPRQIEVGSLPGYHYLYRFTDAGTGRKGAHSHYFLFNHSDMTSLVFQALPDDEFKGLAPVFDQIVGTFRVL
jgi:hypothetical protein